MQENNESLEEFYAKKLAAQTPPKVTDMGNFDVFTIEDRLAFGTTSPSFVRRDFYKIMFYRGRNIFHYGDQSIAINGDTLLFFNPLVPYTYEKVTESTTGYFCVFKEEFLNASIKLSVKEHPLFAAGTKSVFSLNLKQSAEVRSLFRKLFNENKSSFEFKYDLIRGFIIELMYYALKLSSHFPKPKPGDANQRIAMVFSEMLERQFPIEVSTRRLSMRSAKDYADELSIHVNYLNRAVKKVTGRTTSALIFERIISEAKSLLRFTTFDVAQIGYALGFEDPAHFNRFFKKYAQVTPHAFRMV